MSPSLTRREAEPVSPSLNRREAEPLSPSLQGSGPQNRNNPGECRQADSVVMATLNSRGDMGSGHPRTATVLSPRGFSGGSRPWFPPSPCGAFGVLFPCYLSFGSFVGVFRLRSPRGSGSP